MLRSLTRLGLRKGLLGGSRAWLYVGSAAVVLRLVGRLARRSPDVVFLEELDQGHTFVISHFPPGAK
jgi:hypothetical protein